MKRQEIIKRFLDGESVDDLAEELVRERLRKHQNFYQVDGVDKVESILRSALRTSKKNTNE